MPMRIKIYYATKSFSGVDELGGLAAHAGGNGGSSVNGESDADGKWSVTISNLINGATYYGVVVALNSYGGVLSDEFEFVPLSRIDRALAAINGWLADSSDSAKAPTVTDYAAVGAERGYSRQPRSGKRCACE